MDVSIFNLLRHIVKQRVGVSMATTFCLGPRSFSTNSRSSRWWRCRNPFCRCLLVENLFVWLFATFGHLAMAFQKFKLNHAPFNVNWTLLEFGLLQNQLWHSGHRWPASVLTRELADLWFCGFLDLSITIWLRRWIVGGCGNSRTGWRERGASCANHSAAKYLFTPPESKLEQLARRPFWKCAICLRREQSYLPKRAKTKESRVS